MQDLRRQLKRLMHTHKLSQIELALAAKVSQSTVSRALHGPPSKYSEAYQRLCSYAERNLDRKKGLMTEKTNVVEEAFTKIWDGTEHQARAIAKIIEALGDLSTVRAQRRK
jgi:transcriptional regulator with XRE-family HTH domain